MQPINTQNQITETQFAQFQQLPRLRTATSIVTQQKEKARDFEEKLYIKLDSI